MIEQEIEKNTRKRKRSESSEDGSDWEDVIHSSDDDENDKSNQDSLEMRKEKAKDITSTR